MRPLSEFSSNTYSQFGEDGIIREILNRIATQTALDHWCAEFGAWDGIHLSNTCRLIKEEGYNAVLIEGDPARAEQLRANFPQPNVHKICRFITFEGAHTLDKTLAETPIPKNFDFLSIDVDGVDYFIFAGLDDYRPKIICIEYNPTIPNAVDYVQPRDFSIKHGSSAKAFARLAREKGYTVVAITQTNVILVQNELAALVHDHEQSLEQLNPAGNDATYVFVAYDGTLLSNKSDIHLVWHDIKIGTEHIQPLPPFLRQFRGDYGSLRKAFFRLFTAWSGAKTVR